MSDTREKIQLPLQLKTAVESEEVKNEASKKTQQEKDHPVKGILIQPGSETIRNVSSAPVISWDEQIIAEHDLERGTRMKIDEPKTPYHVPSEGIDKLPEFNLGNALLSKPGDVVGGVRLPSESLELMGSSVERKCSYVGQEQMQIDPAELMRRLGESRSEESGKKKKDFEARRKMHYNEFLSLQKARQMSLDEEENEDSS